MTNASGDGPILIGRDIHKTFLRKAGGPVKALDGVSLEVGRGKLTALVGPDGAGKTTLIRLATGLLTPDAGQLEALGIDVAQDPRQVQARIGYMPQKFGLYDDLSILENLELYADLQGVTARERRERYPWLMAMTTLGPFAKRLAGRLSGGMKQKLALACTLIRPPELLILDEPTVGVDPLSRLELWEIILLLVNEQRLTVLVSTSYLDEAERCDHAIVLHEGKVLAQGRPEEVSAAAAGRTFLAVPPKGQTARMFQARLLEDPSVIDAIPEGGRVRIVRDADKSDTALPCPPGSLADVAVTAVRPRLEDGFIVLLRQSAQHWNTDATVSHAISHRQPSRDAPGEAVVKVRDLVRKFGGFTAVDHVNFDVHRGEIFGLLGPNGAGKTTTFRMLCGLLPATSGTLSVAGADLRHAQAAARRHIGYVAQKFSLYGQLSVVENLNFFASAYSLRGHRRRERIDWALRQFELTPFAHQSSGQLPGGFKQRLAMAAALLHEPETLFLDEPTSGADPLARREFWRRITALADQGVTIIVTTHFMEEAEYCDHVAILDGGQVLVRGTPSEIRQHAQYRDGHEPTMEDAFIAIVQESRKNRATGDSADIGLQIPFSRRQDDA